MPPLPNHPPPTPPTPPNSYELEGEEELLSGVIEAGAWGIRLLDNDNAELASYPFAPAFKDSESDKLHKLVAFNHMVNRLRGTAKIQLIGPGGVLSEKSVSEKAPKLQINKPAKNSLVTLTDGYFNLEWEGSDEDKDDLTYLVYYSPDGEVWRPVGGETSNSSMKVRVIGTPPNPQVKIITSDGLRSDEVRLKFYIKKD